jgi:hypothetical protein
LAAYEADVVLAGDGTGASLVGRDGGVEREVGLSTLLLRGYSLAKQSFGFL